MKPNRTLSWQTVVRTLSDGVTAGILTHADAAAVLGMPDGPQNAYVRALARILPPPAADTGALIDDIDAWLAGGEG